MKLPEDPNLTDQPIIPDDNLSPQAPVQLPPARRRRARRSLSLPGVDDRDQLLKSLGKRAFPAFEFFLFSLLCGAILGAGYLLDSHSLLLLGVLLAPLMTPWVGLILASVTGSWRFFFLTLIGFILGGVLIFFGGFLSGLVARTGSDYSMVQASNQSHLWWPNLCVLALGSILLVASFVRSEEKPLLASVMVAYEFYLPLSAAGYGLGRGVSDIWPNGLLVFGFHFALAAILAMLTLVVLRFHPRRFFGYLLPGFLGIASVATILLLSGLGNILGGFFAPRPSAASLPTLTAVPTESPSAFWTSTPTLTPQVFETATPTLEIPASQTPLPSPTLKPTPVYARIMAPTGGGALVRADPNSSSVVVASLINEYLVEILPEKAVVDNVTWVHVRTADGIEGWVIFSVLEQGTPVPAATP